MRTRYLPRPLSSLLVAFIMIPLYAQTQQQGGPQSLNFMNTALPIDHLFGDLIGRMTL